MDPSLRLVPATGPKAAALQDTSSNFGLHDTLRYGPRSIAAEVQTTSTVKERLENWEETQDNLKLTMLRNVYGLHAPVRMLLERKSVAMNAHMPAFSTSNVHLDVLMGRDETLDTVDFMMPNGTLRQPLDIHAEMERKLRM
ncbi:hypothetical protein EIP91_005538 [Steccherinum ochraceum]|uniref:Proteasome maturation factor UMP1 n=1 Tax=Steccherinum ochraceum TaxID=92696 RepID=A0A4R0RVW3_9APHY|nr:hypothetical protein EIP91_005538 [Steccherinum ochraceum]